MKTNTPVSPPKKTSSNSTTVLKIHPTADFAIDYQLLMKPVVFTAMKEAEAIY